MYDVGAIGELPIDFIQCIGTYADRWCSEFTKECQTKADADPNIPNEAELLKENLRLRKELEDFKEAQV